MVDKGTLFVLEDLTGIRGASERVRVKDRYTQVSWAYYDLEQKIMYKAVRCGSALLKVDRIQDPDLISVLLEGMAALQDNGSLVNHFLGQNTPNHAYIRGRLKNCRPQRLF